MKFVSVKNIDEALKEVKGNPNYKVLAGGTDLYVLLNGGFIDPEGFINIWGIDELKGISESGDTVKIGTLTTHTELWSNDLIKKHIPALAQACKTIGARQTQNRGTIGGNVMNASPAGDTLPVLLAYDTTVEVRSVKGKRSIGFKDFYKGYRETALAKDEIVTGFMIAKAAPGEKAGFYKVGARRAQAISKVMGCFRISFDGKDVKDAATAFGSVAPIPVRLSKTETFLKGKELTQDVIEKAGEIASGEVKPINDIRSTSSYRSYICGVLLKRFLKTL